MHLQYYQYYDNIADMNYKDLTKISSNIRTIRRSRDMTQAELAFLLGICQCTLSNLETGRSIPTLEMMIRLCNIFKIRMDYFVSDLYTFDLKRDALEDKAKLRAIEKIINTPAHR